MRVQTTNPLALSLAAANLPEAIVGAPYASYDFKSLLTLSGSSTPLLSAVGWGAPSPLPAGLSLSTDGVLTGTPTLKNETGAAFQVQAGYEAVTTQQGYTLRVLDPLVSLATATIPAGTVGQAFSYDFKTRLSVSRDPGYNANLATFSSSGALPPGLTLAENGVVSGTPTTKNTSGTNFQVIATYKTRTGQQAYTIVVNGAVLQVTQISAGYTYTCAVTTSGGAKCWGNNASGQLGNGTATNSPTPVTVTGLASGVAKIAAGNQHTCAVTTSGAAKCWGANGAGQLGNGTMTSSSSIPVDVSGLASGVAQITAGGSHTCVITNSGGAKCWGYNGAGQLGDRTKEIRVVPTDVLDLGSTVTQLAAGSEHTCAVTSLGAARCWGYNGYGRLGNGQTTGFVSPDTTVIGLGSGVTQIATHGYFTCAMTSSGAVKCWGLNSSGQLGTGSASPMIIATPVDVTGLTSGVVQIATGHDHACAVTASGAAKCWGNNGSGELGNGSSAPNSATPVDVAELTSGVVQMTAGPNHTCAVTSSGAAKCWGYNGYGQLGDGTVAGHRTPVEVSP